MVAIAVTSVLAYRQAHRIGWLRDQVREHRRVAAQASVQLDSLTEAHAELLAATATVPVPGAGGTSWSHRFTITQYLPRSPDYGDTNDGFTATMMKADPAARIVAVDPTLIPYGSSIWIEGLGWFNAQDCGSAIKGYRLDVLTATAAEAFAFGRQERFVLVLPRQRAL